MKINMEASINDLKGNPVERDGKPFTLRDVCQESLVTSYADEQGLAGGEKVARFNLAMKISDIHGPEVDLSAAEVTKIQTLVAKGFGPLVVGRANELLEPQAATA